MTDSRADEAQAQGGGEVVACQMSWRPKGMHEKVWTCRHCKTEVTRDGSSGHPFVRCTAPPSAPVGVPVDVVREYLDARACYEEATRRTNSHAPAPILKHDDPVVLRLRDARVALDNAITLAQRPAARRQYFYKVNECPAEGSQSPNCICWHDEGTGPLADWSTPTWIRIDWAEAQQPAAVDGECATAAIQFALNDPEGMTFLRLWNEGEFNTLRREWPEAPSSIYIGADPLAQQPAAVDGAMVERALSARAGSWSVRQLFADEDEAPDIMRIALTAALACVARATAAKDAKIKALRAEVAEAREAYENRTRDYYAQGDAYDILRGRAERLAEALRAVEQHAFNRRDGDQLAFVREALNPTEAADREP